MKPNHRHVSLLNVLFFCTLAASAQPADLSTASIPAALRTNASVVKRFESFALNVEDNDNASFHIRQVFTILNEKGKKHLLFNQFTTKYISLKDAEIRVYDSTGKQLAKYKKHDMQSVAIGEGLVEDGQVTYYYYNALTFPVTVEFEYEIKLTGTLSLPSYQVSEENMSVEESYFSASVPNDVGFRYLARNISIKPVNDVTGKYTHYKWEVKNLPAKAAEEGSASMDDCYPVVRITLNKFSFYGHEGDLSSWNTFGAWLSALYQGTDELAAERKQFFSDLVRNAPDDISKAKIIYDYLQRNFRYVSIQLGIGGFRPFPANFTDQKKYGDCKGLSNFMKAALGAVGIKSYLAIINAGPNAEPVDPSFPFNHFNHVILCIPRSPDSVWLECTSSSTEFGKLGTFTQNRNALLVTEKGGVLVSTPISRPEENLYSAYAVVKVNNEGFAVSKTIFHSSGYFRELFDHIYKQKKDDQHTSIVKLLSYKQPDDFTLTQDTKGEMQADTLEASFEKVHDFKAGNKYFIPARMYRIWDSKLPKSDGRSFDYFFDLPPFQFSDTTVFELPDGFKAETLPQAKTLHCEYADYRSSYWYDEKQNRLNTSATLTLKKYRIPAGQYAAVKKFFDDLMADEQQRMVVVSE
jgi:transglutaminase-like putative cysteine protease